MCTGQSRVQAAEKHIVSWGPHRKGWHCCLHPTGRGAGGSACGGWAGQASRIQLTWKPRRATLQQEFPPDLGDELWWLLVPPSPRGSRGRAASHWSSVICTFIPLAVPRLGDSGQWREVPGLDWEGQISHALSWSYPWVKTAVPLLNPDLFLTLAHGWIPGKTVLIPIFQMRAEPQCPLGRWPVGDEHFLEYVPRVQSQGSSFLDGQGGTCEAAAHRQDTGGQGTPAFPDCFP